jgi:transposase
MRLKGASCSGRRRRWRWQAALSSWTALTRATKPERWLWSWTSTPVVPPNPNRLEPWEYDKELYKKRNEVKRLFRRLKAFRRIFTRYDKLDRMFTAFIHLALIADALR